MNFFLLLLLFFRRLCSVPLHTQKFTNQLVAAVARLCSNSIDFLSQLFPPSKHKPSGTGIQKAGPGWFCLFSEKVLELVKKALSLLIVLFSRALIKLFQDVSLLLGKVFRHLNGHPHKLISSAAAAQMGDSLALEFEDVSPAECPHAPGS